MADRYLRHPFQAIPHGWRPALFLPLLALTLVLMAVLLAVDAPLQTPAARQGIVSYELAGSVQQAGRILDSWDQKARAHAGFSLGLDYLYMASYALTISLACAWAAEALGRRAAWLGALGAALAWGQGIAALLDATENVALTTMLLASVVAPWPAIARWCALVKFALIAMGLSYAAIGGLAWTLARLHRGGARGRRSG